MSVLIKNLKLKALLCICQTIDTAVHLQFALENILQILSEELSMKRGMITLFDDYTHTLQVAASYGIRAEERKRGIYSANEGVTGTIFETKKPYYIQDISKDKLFLNKTKTRSLSQEALSFLGVPILLQNEAIGVLTADRLFDSCISPEEDVDFLSVIATLIAQFISLNRKIDEREQGLIAENTSLKYQVMHKASNELYMVGTSFSMMEVQRKLQKVAPTKATVLLLGESGVGKSLIAQIIHNLSERKDFPFVKVNCATIPENLLESELFGVEKGAYTGANASRAGRFEEAHKGTIFLDEIGELPLSIQVKLLRIIQEKDFERLGSTKTRHTDVRIITATHQDLEKLSKQGQFRQDLYYRLNVFPIHVPSLRERQDDIPRLLQHFLHKISKEYNASLHITPKAMDMLTQYHWPGNVREMENLLERLVILAENNCIDVSILQDVLHEQSEASRPAPQISLLPPVPSMTCDTKKLQDMEKDEVISALQRNNWTQYKAAKELGLTPRQMGYRVKKYALETLIAAGQAQGI